MCKYKLSDVCFCGIFVCVGCESRCGRLGDTGQVATEGGRGVTALLVHSHSTRPITYLSAISVDEIAEILSIISTLMLDKFVQVCLIISTGQRAMRRLPSPAP